MTLNPDIDPDFEVAVKAFCDRYGYNKSRLDEDRLYLYIFHPLYDLDELDSTVVVELQSRVRKPDDGAIDSTSTVLVTKGDVRFLGCTAIQGNILKWNFSSNLDLMLGGPDGRLDAR